MSDFLAAEHIQTFSGYDAAHITADLDLVVVGNAISRGNPELEAVLERKIRYCSLPGDHSRPVSVGRRVGRRGRNARQDDHDVAHRLAADTRQARPDRARRRHRAELSAPAASSYRVGSGRHFVIEGDEYDSAFFDKTAKFLKYLPDIAIINNIEFDHADIYANLDEVRLAFRRLANLVPRTGLLLLGARQPGRRGARGHSRQPGRNASDWTMARPGRRTICARATGSDAIRRSASR